MNKNKNYWQLLLIIVLLSQFVISAHIHSSYCAETESATVEKTLVADRAILFYATEYYIIVSPGDEEKEKLLSNEMEDIHTFIVTEKNTGEYIKVERVTSGSSENQGEKKSFDLWGNFKPDAPYIVTINYPNGTSSNVDTTTKVEDKTPLIQRFGEKFNLTIEPMFVEQTKDIGFKYNASFTPWTSCSINKKTQQIKIIKFSITSKGELSTNIGNKQIQSSITNGFDFSLRWHPRLTISTPGSVSVPAETRQYVYPVVFEIKPVEFESNQDFKITNYTCKIQLAFALPYSDWPILWWHIKTGVNRPFFPLVISSGYTLVKNVKNPSSIDSIAISHRWDSDIFYTFPVSNKIDFSGEFKGFMDIKEKTFNRLFDISLKYYLTDDYQSGFVVSYQNGELPPEYKETKSLRLGFDFAFF